MNAENSVFIDIGYIQRQELYEENILKIFYHVFGRPIILYRLRKAVGFQFLLAMNA